MAILIACQLRVWEDRPCALHAFIQLSKDQGLVAVLLADQEQPCHLLTDHLFERLRDASNTREATKVLTHESERNCISSDRY